MHGVSDRRLQSGEGNRHCTVSSLTAYPRSESAQDRRLVVSRFHGLLPGRVRSRPSPTTALGRVLPATALARAAAVQRTAGIQYPVAVGSVRGWTERSPRVDRGSDRPPLMMYFHRSTSGKLSRPLPFHCRAQRITKRGPPMRRIAWERENLPSARLNPAIAR